MARYEIIQSETDVSLGIYEGETAEDAILAMLRDAGADDAEPDPGLQAIEVVYPARDGRPSEKAVCETCGRGGYVSDWPGNDPANRRATVRVLCADIRGRLICDECADEAGGTWTIDRDGVWVGDWTLEGTVADLGDLQDEMDAALVAAEEAGDDGDVEVGPYRARRL